VADSVRDEPLKIDLDPEGVLCNLMVADFEGAAAAEPEWVEEVAEEQGTARPPEDDRCSFCYGIGFRWTPGFGEEQAKWLICRACAETGKITRSANTRRRPRPTKPPAQ